MKKMSCLLIVCVLCASALATPTSVYDFVIFSGGGTTIDGGYETEIGGHTLINGDIGSNQDLFMQGNPLMGYPAQLNGSAYAGGNLTFGQDLTVGSSLELREVVANGEADIGGGTTIWGTLDAFSATLGTTTVVTGGVTVDTTPPGSIQNTFGVITMPTATTFTAGGADQTVDTVLDQLTLAPGIYGTLSTSQQNQTVNLSSGDYYIDAFTVQGGFTLEIDLTSGDPINIYSVGDLDFTAQNIQLKVKGTGTSGAFVPISDAPDLASLIYLETHAAFNMGGENLWGGTIYASLGNVSIGQYINWTGAVYAFDTVDVADHGTWNYVAIPEPATICLLGLGSVALLRKRRA